MKETNNTDNKLRQLENQSLPDLSRQDEHWQEIKKMLQPGLTAVKPAATGKIWKWIVAACIIGGVAFTGYKFLNTNKKETKKEVAASIVTKPAIEVLDTMKNNNTVANLFPYTPANNAIKVVTTAVGFLRIIPDNTDTLTNPLLTLTDTATDSPDKPKATLAEFFAQLEKPSQEFVIDNSRDTVINGNDGTALLIPANTFNTREKVTIVLKEYYSYEDIITNKLCTTSDGKQLVSGGMIHLTAMAEGKEINMQPQKSIRWFVPDTTAEMKDMQLFNGQQNNQRMLSYSSTSRTMLGDTLEHEERYDNVNWMPQDVYFGNGFGGNGTQGLQVRVVDLRDYPFKVITTGKKTKAFYFWYEDSEISKEQLATYLLSKNNKWYDKIIIRKTKQKDDWCSYNIRNEVINCYTSLGDTMAMTPRLANIYKLKIIDTVKERRNIVGSKKITDNQRMLFKLGNRYGVDINSLGWINCDRFYKKRGNNIHLYVDLKDTAANYYTVLVFDKIKSMMAGSISGNKVMFAGVPEGETAKVISVGIKDGKPVAAMKLLTISQVEVNSLKFEETTPAAFKEQAATMDK